MGSVAVNTVLFLTILTTLFNIKIAILYQALLIFVIIGLMHFYNIKLTQRLQKFFFVTKISLIFLFVGFGIFLFFQGISHVCENVVAFDQSLAAIPLLMFSFAGFELFFSIADQLNKKYKPEHVILSAFFMVIFLYTLYQFVMTFFVGGLIVDAKDFQEVISILFLKVNSYPFIAKLAMVAVAVSSFGSAYGILSSNINNFMALVRRDVIKGSSILSFKSRYGSFVFPILIITTIPWFYIFLFKNISFLVQLSALGTLSTYSVFFVAYTRNKQKNIFLVLLSLLSILIFLITFFVAFQSNFFIYFVFAIILLSGLLFKS
jgi:amino acid transporter